MTQLDSKQYWDERGNKSFYYKGEPFYTVTPIPLYYKRREVLLDLFSDAIRTYNPRNVCDFGCGDGWYLKFIKERFSDIDLFGLDLSENMISRAKEECPSARLRVSSKGIDFNETFDLVYLFAVFAHVDRDEALLALFENIYKKLNVGGVLIIFEQTGVERTSGDGWCRRKVNDYTLFAEQSGFEVLEQQIISFPIHRRLFEKIIAPFYYRFFTSGHNYFEKCINANNSKTFRFLSSLFLFFTRHPLGFNGGKNEGNSFYIFRKPRED